MSNKIPSIMISEAPNTSSVNDGMCDIVVVIYVANMFDFKIYTEYIKRKGIGKLKNYKKIPPSVYEMKIVVDTNQVDHNQNMKFSTIQKLFQSSAGDHTRLMEIGFLDLLGNNLSWVITKVRTKIIRLPRLYEKLLIRTWPRKPGTIISERDMEILDESGNIIIRTTSMWCLIDNNTRRAVRMEIFKHNEPEYIDERTIEEGFLNNSTFELDTTKTIENQHNVVLTDLDVNGHMNNTKYIDIIFNTLTKHEYDSKRVVEINLKYKKEARLGDRVVTYKNVSENRVIVNGFVDNVEIFESSIIFEN